MDLASDEPVLIAIPKVLIPRSIAIGATVEIIGAATAAAPAPAIAIITLSYINEEGHSSCRLGGHFLSLSSVGLCLPLWLHRAHKKARHIRRALFTARVA
ncbi:MULTISPECIES: hypothetical protein [unclassified Pseudomonas]|uniref:hypothetical protein n=1 Tax=unclassified Pseudomonas TaxID=196821 RepID=UPI0011A8C16E|nr:MULTISPECIES: hypothetical protein [unclassified Pseudomonas]